MPKENLPSKTQAVFEDKLNILSNIDQDMTAQEIALINANKEGGDLSPHVANLQELDTLKRVIKGQVQDIINSADE